ncbi:MAG: Aldehyde Dehydrogenase [Chthoniobacteraceae bacterium]|nr:Aldehyde Dehydrogenase [Chthoniobacteraceae bacterium]
MTLHGKSLIAGLLVESNTGSFHAISPLDNQPLEPLFHECSLDNVDLALELADEAFAVYRKTSAEARAQFLEKIAEEIIALGDELLQRAHLETGLPLDRLTGERGRTVGQLRLFATVIREGSWCDARIDTALPDRQPVPRPDLRRMVVPLGPVIVFGSSNFPLAFSVAGGDSASALAAGCPVIVKAHRAHPGTGELVGGAIARAAESCGLPAGVFSLMHGSGAEIGVALVKHPLARAAGFTGSRTAGRNLFDAANARPEPIPVFAEMSSLNPLFILPGALKTRGQQIAEGLKGSITMGVGQFCTKPGLIFGVGGADLQAFTGYLESAIETSMPGTMLSPGICRSFHDGLTTMGKIAGVIPLANSDATANPSKTHGAPTIYATDTANFLEQHALQEEVFGPYALLVTAQDTADLIRVAEKLEGQLTATLHGTPEDIAAAGDLIAVLERKAGRLVINGFPTGVEVSPAMNHGGPYPATTDARYTSVGTAAIQRWARPVCYQNFPQTALPLELRNENPGNLMRQINGNFSRDAIQD